MKKSAIIALSGLLVVSAISSASYAKPHGKQSNDVAVTIGISIGDRHTIESFLREDYGKKCPPGLAKKRNGCLPPGQAKKYHLGHVLDSDYRDLPGYILDKLHPYPGYHYVMVDRDVLLIAEASKKIIDAVTLLSAVK